MFREPERGEGGNHLNYDSIRVSSELSRKTTEKEGAGKHL
jgi:hypothetical protein